MADHADHNTDSRLLEMHLGRLSPGEQAELERQIERDPALASEHEALSAMFAALQAERRNAPHAPAALTQSICAKVAAAGPPPRVVEDEHDHLVELVEQENVGIIRLGGIREIAAVAAMIVLAVGVGVPGLLHMRERGRRIACSANLANIGRGMQAYAMANHDGLPFAGWGRNVSWEPTDAPGLRTQPNRRHAYVLLRTREVPARTFVCPSSRDVPMPDDQVAFYDDFPESRNISYAYQNMAGTRPTLRNNPNLPVFGDDNPLFDNGIPLLQALGLRNAADMNSRAHGGAGQNILTLRGNVRWVTTPRAGIDGDNIWTLQNVREYTGREGPRHPADAHLLK